MSRFSVDISSPGAIPVSPDLTSKTRSGVMMREVKMVRQLVAEAIRALGLPVLYPGSYADVYFPIALTQATRVIMVDPELIGQDVQRHLQNDLHKLNASGITYSQDKKQVGFTCGVPPEYRQLFLYPEDATTFLPKEAEQGVAAVLMKAPTPHGDLPNLLTHGGISKPLSVLVKGGFVICNSDIFGILLANGVYHRVKDPGRFQVTSPVLDQFWVYKKIS